MNILIVACAILTMLLIVRLFPSKGAIGEFIVARKLEKLPKGKYMVLNDVILPTPHGTSQIDHIVVSIFGIFVIVIETKNYKGFISGGQNSEYWTQNIWGHKYPLYNPILQNASHIKVLRALLPQYDNTTMVSIVAFSDEANLGLACNGTSILHWGQIVPEICRYDKVRLTWDMVNMVHDIIEGHRIAPSREIQKRHAENIRKVTSDRYEAMQSGRCPRCGGNLVYRVGIHGSFHGCSNYQRCRYVTKRRPDFNSPSNLFSLISHVHTSDC